MDKGRLESFSDGVIAIIITIMAIVIEPPDDYDLPTLINMLPQILMYAVSFFMIGVNWINHHLLMNTISRVNGKILWANLLYLFFLSFCPVATGWVGKSRFAPIPLRCYAVMHLLIALGYLLLEHVIAAGQQNIAPKAALRSRTKEILAIVLIAAGVLITFTDAIRMASFAAFIASTAIWALPDKRVGETISQE